MSNPIVLVTESTHIIKKMEKPDFIEPLFFVNDNSDENAFCVWVLNKTWLEFGGCPQPAGLNCNFIYKTEITE